MIKPRKRLLYPIWAMLWVSLGLVVVLGMATPGIPPVFGSPLDKAVEFYTTSLPNPPKIALDVDQVMALAETGDVIIENNRAFPQWYVAIAALVPSTRFIHAGMVVKGHVLASLWPTFTKTDCPFRGYRRGTFQMKGKNGMETRWRWAPVPLDPNRKYVITPEVVGENTMSCIVALDLQDYLIDPAVGFPVKHIKVLRAPIRDQAALNRLTMYLGYHLYQKTTYDMGFDTTEPEVAVKRKANGELTFDLTKAPVPLYCTELCYRSLAEADIEVPTTSVSAALIGSVAKVPRIPKGYVAKLKAPFITADCFIRKCSVVYQNPEPPKPGEVVKTIIDEGWRNLCYQLSRKFDLLLEVLCELD